MTDHAQSLPPPARYLPIDERFELKVGLSRLGADLGNGAADGRVFQLDRQWPAYRAAKLAARAERLSKYVCRSEAFAAREQRALTDFLLERLAEDAPGWFQRRRWRLHCRLTSETLHFDERLRLARSEAGPAVGPPYADALDALLCQVQEDLAFVSVSAQGERLTYLHLCQPNHWAAQDKLDGGFEALHGPVPGFARIARQSARLMQSLVERGPFVRFAWGVATDARLNHHPQPAPGCSAAEWHGRRLDPARPRLHLRIERQVMVGLPEVSGFLFTIRTYLRDVAELDGPTRQRVAAAIASMDEATAVYKGLAEQRGALVEWLRSPIQQ